MFKRFGQIFWGLLLVILDFNLNRIDVLPDVLGYLLVALGCRGLSGVARGFAIASSLAWVLTGFAVIHALIQLGARIHWSWFQYLTNLTDCAMMWFLLGGVMELATARQRPDLAERASHSRIAYVALMALATLTGLMARNSRDLAQTLAVLFVIGILLLFALILYLLHRVKHELADDRGG